MSARPFGPMLALVGLLGAPLPGIAQEPGAPAPIDDARPRLTVALTPAELTVGDRVTAVLTVIAPEDQLTGSPRFPDWEATWGRAEIVEVDEPESLAPRGGLASFRQRLVLAAFRPGDIELPPREVELPRIQGLTRLTTPADLSFHITPVLPPQETERSDRDGEAEEEREVEPKPEAPPHELPLTRAFWWAAGSTAGVCALLALLLWRRAHRPERLVERLSPLARLETELARLPAASSLVEGHASLSRALRRYLGERLAFPAAESTTSEVRRAVAARHLPDSVREGSSDVLAACDLVKFARRETSPAALRRHAETTRRVGRELELFLQPPAEAEHAATPAIAAEEPVP